MSLYTTLASLSQTPASNAADGASDAPSTIDNQLNLLASFIAQLRDGPRAGQCRLAKSGANLLLSPYNGNSLVINGVPCSIPSAGVTLAATALTPGTAYNIYAVATAGVVTSLEASTTAHSADTATGVEIKTGDATRSLVGKARPITGPAWQDTDAQRFVISWFNRTPKRIYNVNAGVPTTTSLTPVVLVGIMEFLAWGDAAVPISHVGSTSNNTTNAATSTAIGFDTSTGFSHAPVIYQAYGVGTNGSAAGGSTFIPSEGYHFAYTLGQVSSGTGSWGAGIEMSGVIQG